MLNILGHLFTKTIENVGSGMHKPLFFIWINIITKTLKHMNTICIFTRSLKSQI